MEQLIYLDTHAIVWLYINKLEIFPAETLKLIENNPTGWLRLLIHQLTHPTLTGISMNVVTTNHASTKLPYLINEVADSHQPILITGEPFNAILISEEDLSAIQETLYLLSVPGMRESIKEGLQTPLEECSKELKW